MIALARLWGVILPVSMAALVLSSCATVQTAPPNLIDGNADVMSAFGQQEAGHFEEAEKRWLSIEKKATDSNDKHVLEQCRYWLARLYAEMGNYAKSIDFYSQYLKGKDRQRFDDLYRAVAWNEAELADLYFEIGDWSAATAHYERALEEWQRYGRWPETIGVLHRVALCRWRGGAGADPRAAFERAVKMYDKMSFMPAVRQRRWRFDVDVALMLDDYARYLTAIGQREESSKVASRAVNVWNQLNDFSWSEGRRADSSRAAKAKGADVETVTGKVEMLNRLAEHLCRMGRQVDAMHVYDASFYLLSESKALDARAAKAGNAQLVRDLYSRKEHCLTENTNLKKPPSDAAQTGPVTGPAAAPDNPYESEFLSLRSQQECFDRHQDLCHRYAWAVPNQEALAVLQQNQPIIEIGAGTGYWAHLLRRRGVKIAAFDLNPVPSTGNQWHRGAGRSWTTVLSGDETAVRRSSARTLFLCWPPEVNNCAYNALRLFKGDTVIYVGEGPGGCSGTAEFHKLLARDWDLVGQVELPQWPGVYDGLFVYLRKRASTASGGRYEAAGTKPLLTAEAASMESKNASDLCRQVLGAELAKAAEHSPTVTDDLVALLSAGFKVRFIVGPCRAYFDQKTKTINIASSCSISRRLLAIAHEYGHALLNPTVQPVGGKVSKHEFVEHGMQDEADAVVHELVAARELRKSGIPLDAPTEKLLDAFDSNGRSAVEAFLRAARNSANDESYETHFSRWYDEVVKPVKDVR